MLKRAALLVLLPWVLGAARAAPPAPPPPALAEDLRRLETLVGAQKLALLVETIKNNRIQDLVLSRQLLEQCLDLARSIGDKTASGYCWLRKGSSALWRDQDEMAARAAFLEAVQFAEETKDWNTLYNAYYYLGYIGIHNNDFVSGIDQWTKASRAALNANSYKDASIVIGDMALLFAEFNDPIEADLLLADSQRYAKMSGDTFAIRGAELAYANNKSYQGDYAGAIAAYKRLIDNPDGLSPAPRPLDLVQAWAGMAIAAAEAKQPEAMVFARKAMAVARTDPGPTNYLMDWAWLAQAHAAIAAGDAVGASKAVNALMTSDNTKLNILTDEERFAKLRADLYKLRGDYKQANSFLNTAYEKAKDIGRLKAVQAAAVARARAEVRDRDAALALAVAKDKLTAAKLERSKLFLLFAVATMAALSGMTLVAFLLFRRERRSAAALTDSNAEIRAQARLLDRSLEEKQVLLREINHRVKNNLQNISSLVEMQAQKLAHGQETGAAHALREVYGRIETMALLQKQLFELDGAPFVPLPSLFRNMLEGLIRLFDKPVTLDLEVEDIDLDVRLASPLGLILNELASNALEHAFPADGGGRLRVVFRTVGRDHVLEVADDGVGLPAGFELSTGDSMGLRLVRNLAKQLQGRFAKLETAQGAAWRLHFPASQRFWQPPASAEHGE